MVPYKEPIKVAILGGNPVVVRALDVLLCGVGCEVRLLEEPETSKVEDLLEGIAVLLVGSGLSDEYREDFLGALAASTPRTAVIPILSLSPSLKGSFAEHERLVQWPCRTEDLMQ